MSEKKNEKLWGGRFQDAADPLMEAFTQSVSYDRLLAHFDIQGSKAHAAMLKEQKLLTEEEWQAIDKGLDEIAGEIDKGTFVFDPKKEDVHMNIESALKEKIGTPAGKLHTGRSRNDQIALDERLYLCYAVSCMQVYIRNLQLSLTLLAEKNQDVVIPGFTHLQYAMPVLASHHLLAYVEMLDRDYGRFSDQFGRILRSMPLGAGALAGSGLPLDRELVADKLGFHSVAHNSLDAVGDRDCLLEFLSACAICAMHLSRLCEDMILWMSQPFSFIDIADRFCTGSSLMPQKKNPDILELVRGKTGRVYGDLVALLTVTKGLPLAYNRDLQEDKEPLFDAAETLFSSLQILSAMLPTVTYKRENTQKAVGNSFLLATDWTDYLVRKGMPFREAHGCVGQAVALAVNKGCELTALTKEELGKISPLMDEGILKIASAQQSVEAKKTIGSTNPEMVKKEIEEWKKFLSDELKRYDAPREQ